MTEKNRKIRETLHNLYKKLNEELTQTSFEKVLLNERQQTSEIVYSHQDGLVSPDELRKKHTAELNDLLSNKSLMDSINALPATIHKINTQNAKKHLSTKILELLKAAEIQCKSEQNHKLNMLFFEYDYEPQFSICGFDDSLYEGVILDGSSYIKANWNKELFSRINFDFSICMKPILEFEEKVGEDILLEISNTFSDEHYQKIKNLYILNTYKLLHETFDEIAADILQFKIPMADKVHVFANEHDCEHFSIYEVQTT